MNGIDDISVALLVCSSDAGATVSEPSTLAWMVVNVRAFAVHTFTSLCHIKGFYNGRTNPRRNKFFIFFFRLPSPFLHRRGEVIRGTEYYMTSYDDKMSIMCTECGRMHIMMCRTFRFLQHHSKQLCERMQY